MVEKALRRKKEGKNKKTYNSRDSLMVTHSTTDQPIFCLCMAERTGYPVQGRSLWSYVKVKRWRVVYIIAEENQIVFFSLDG